jgi:mannosyl-glycoprotein endo-beta-N-acetylglucosaminidase/stage II sporulation protein P
LVIEATKGTGIFPSVKMAQQILESADKNGKAGNNPPALKANNHYGIKADPTWNGPKIAIPTPNDKDKISYFRFYHTDKGSIIDHVKFLQSRPRYTDAGVFKARTPEEQTMALEKAGYAEGKDYSKRLLNVIQTNNLKQLDVAAGLAKPKQETETPLILTAVAILTGLALFSR